MFGEEYGLRSSSLCSFHHTPVTSCLLAARIPLSTLFSDIFSLCFRVMTKFHNHIKTEGKIMVLYILIFTFFDNRREDKRF
jgi:hypothetical protein